VLEHPLYMVCNVCNCVLVMTSQARASKHDVVTAHILFTHLTHPLYRLKCTEQRGVVCSDFQRVRASTCVAKSELMWHEETPLNM
jgi:hypothetical protein